MKIGGWTATGEKYGMSAENDDNKFKNTRTA